MSLYLLSNHQQGDPKFSRRPRKSTGLHLTCFGHFSGQVEHYLNKKECLQSMNCLALLWSDRKLSPHHCKEGDFSDKKFFSFQNIASSLLPHWLPALLMQQLHSSSLWSLSKMFHDMSIAYNFLWIRDKNVLQCLFVKNIAFWMCCVLDVKCSILYI